MWREVVWISIAGVGLYFLGGVYGLARGAFDNDGTDGSDGEQESIAKRLRRVLTPDRYAALVVLFVIAWKIFVARFEKPAITADFIFCGPAALFTRSTVLPLIFLVGDAIYYGPLIVLAVLLWRPLCRHAAEAGLGTLAYLALGFAISISSESRHLLHVVPFVVAFVALTLDRRGLSWAQAALVVVAQVTCSKICSTRSTSSG